MDYIGDNREKIDIRYMLYAGLKKWKLMLILGFLLAVVIGVKEGVSLSSAMNNNYANWNTVKKIRDQKIEYSALVEKAELENITVEKKISDQQEYLDKSIYINLDPYDIQCAEAEYYISTDYKIMPGMNYQNIDYTDTVAKSYVSILTNADILNEISATYGMENRYLKEILEISVSDSILSITVIHDNADMARQILDSVISYLPSIGEEITDGIAEHTLNLINKTSYSYIDLNLIDRQQEQKALLQSLSQTKTQNDNIIDDATYSLNELEKEEENLNNDNNIIRKTIKYAVIGVIAGLFLAYVYGCFVYVVSDKVYIGDEISNRFGLRIIGRLASGKNKSVIDKCICKAEGRIYAKTTDANYRVIAENIIGMKEKHSSIFMTGCVEDARLKDICERIAPLLSNITVKTGGDIFNNPEAVNGLAKCDAVILVEQCGKSKYSVISSEINKAEWFGKTVIGCVVIE